MTDWKDKIAEAAAKEKALRDQLDFSLVAAIYGGCHVKIQHVPVSVPTAEEHMVAHLGIGPVRFMTRDEMKRLYPTPPAT